MQVSISFPPDQVLFLLPLPISAFFDYLLDFPFFLAFNNVRWWFDEIWAMLFCFLVGHKKGGMEYIIYFPGGWEAEFVSDV